MFVKRSTLPFILLLASLTGIGNSAFAQTRILVGFPPGGAPDTIARLFAEHWRQQTNASIVVENRIGATGKIAVDALLAAPTDGQVLLVAPASSLTLTAVVMKSVTYDAVRDFVPIVSLAENGFGVAAGPAAHSRSFSEFKKWAAANPALAAYATPGVGSTAHFVGAQLAKLMNTPMSHVPYRGGSNAVTDVLGGQVPILITTEQLLVPYEKQGKLNTLLITSRKRNANMPNVPTARELGFPQLETVDWFGVFAKAGTAPDVVARLKQQAQDVLRSSSYKKAILDMGFDVPESTTTPLETRVAQELAGWVERKGITGFQAAD